MKGKPSAIGMAAGAVVGLVAITPASGYVTCRFGAYNWLDRRHYLQLSSKLESRQITE